MSNIPYKYNYEKGQKFGDIEFISRVPKVSNGESPRANFKCSCGNEFAARISAVKAGTTKSCGCLRPKIISQPKNIYEIGQEINGFVYLGNAPYRPNFPRKANFICHCGNKFITTIYNIENGETKSCGCITKKLQSEKCAAPEKEIPVLNEDDINRFWEKVGFTANDDKCWDWQANLSNNRYGSFSIKGQSFKANRVAYFISYNQDPKELSVMHSCDNAKCCNPKHLSLGTHLENMQDMAAKGRAKKK